MINGFQKNTTCIEWLYDPDSDCRKIRIHWGKHLVTVGNATSKDWAYYEEVGFDEYPISTSLLKDFVREISKDGGFLKHVLCEEKSEYIKDNPHLKDNLKQEK